MSDDTAPHCLTLTDIELIFAAYSEEGADELERLPSLHCRYTDKLESILALPRAGFASVRFYNTLSEQAAVQFYEIIKQHPFFDGNKRMACLILFTFLYLNNIWIDLSNERLYTMARTVARSDPHNRDENLDWIRGMIEEHKHEIEIKESRGGFMGLDIRNMLSNLNPFKR